MEALRNTESLIKVEHLDNKEPLENTEALGNSQSDGNLKHLENKESVGSKEPLKNTEALTDKEVVTTTTTNIESAIDRYINLKVDDLKQECKSRRLPVGGNKTELVEKLVKSDKEGK